MDKIKITLIVLVVLILNSCSNTPTKSTATIDRIVIDSLDNEYGYYLQVLPKSNTIKGVLVLLPGFGQKAEDVFLDTKFHEFAFENNILTVGFAGRMRLTADSVVQDKLNAVLRHLMENVAVDTDNFVLGGFSAGGVIALRYAELCHEFPDRFPISPKGVFMADAPVDLFHSWKMQQENLKNNHSEISVNEAKWLTKFYKEYYGTTPSENPDFFVALSPFSIDKKWGSNEQFLQNVAVRAYHDIDVAWRLKNRNQTARFDNYIATSELINRLMLMGNTKAEFIQTFQTGYRRNGDRHPHSWSIIDEVECIEWIKELIK